MKTNWKKFKRDVLLWFPWFILLFGIIMIIVPMGTFLYYIVIKKTVIVSPALLMVALTGILVVRTHRELRKVQRFSLKNAKNKSP